MDILNMSLEETKKLEIKFKDDIRKVEIPISELCSEFKGKIEEKHKDVRKGEIEIIEKSLVEDREKISRFLGELRKSDPSK